MQERVLIFLDVFKLMYSLTTIILHHITSPQVINENVNAVSAYFFGIKAFKPATSSYLHTVRSRMKIVIKLNSIIFCKVIFFILNLSVMTVRQIWFNKKCTIPFWNLWRDFIA